MRLIKRTRGVSNKRSSVGICYPIIPNGVDRDTYVRNCLRQGVISAQFDDGSVAFNVKVGLSVLPLIDFPKDVKQLGSALVYINENNHNIAIVIDRVIKDDESISLKENEFKLEQYTDNGLVSVSGTGKDGNLFVNVSGKNTTGGKIYITVSNSENTGEMVINLQGNLQLEMQEAIIEAIKDININSKTKINLGNADLEPLLKGSKTVEELNKEIQALTDLIQSIGNIVPVNVVSGAPDATWGTWKAAVATIIQRGDLSEVKSEKVFSE